MIQRWLTSPILVSLAILLATATDAGAAVLGGLTRETTAQVGQTYRSTILLSNRELEPQEVKLYQTDYVFFCDGTTQYGQPGKLQRSNADWITFSPSRLTIPPQGQSVVNYTIEVPDDSSLTGTYWSMLMVELIGKGSPESALPPKEGEIRLGVRQIVRYGTQIVTHIGDTGTPKPRFIGTKLLAENENGRILQIDLENDGDRWMQPRLWAEVFDEKGRSMGKFEGGTKRVYPGTSVRFQLDLSDVPQGKYKALVVGDAGGDQVFGATYTLKIQNSQSAE
jgi:hypothetical protein